MRLTFPLFSCLLTLAGCGGGDTAGVMGTGSAAAFLGAAVLTDPSNTSLTLATATADAAASGQVTLQTNGETFQAASGFQLVPGASGRVATDGSGVLTETVLLVDSDIILFDGTFDGGDPSVFWGLIGPVTTAPPTRSGSALWVGEGFVSRTSASGPSFGPATIVADFDHRAAVDAQITGLIGGADQVDLNDMSITGDRFNGNSIVLRRNGSVVEPLGTIARAEASGFFSGDAIAGLPSEVGGLFVLEGASDTMVGGFVGVAP